MKTTKLGPLSNGSVAAIVGGGPGGAGCALALLRQAEEKNISLRVVVFEGKIFEKSTHYNQCVGVLSPPLQEILQDELELDFPHEMAQREIRGYILNGTEKSLQLTDTGSTSIAVRRVNFDDFLLREAEKHGAEIIHSRVTNLEIHDDNVRIYSENGNINADVVVGAFGLDDGASKVFERDTSYRQPRFLDSIVTKIHPGMDFMNGFDDYIHAYLPPIHEIEFGAITPKHNHLTINIAGSRIKTQHMDIFLKLPQVAKILPPKSLWDKEELDYYKGRFPIGIAGGFYGDRFVTVGDAAGMVRPFKGKGINSGIITGIRAAKVMFEHGISRNAFRNYHKACSDITADLPYGKILRFMTIKLAHLKMIDPVLELGKKDADAAKILFDCVSAHESLANIYKFMRRRKVFWKMGLAVLRQLFHRQAA
ncbi:MAG: NAD(P)/FAD-dependent oxidoreductase [FCB group bacterium]|nr:NAD(P)/FAD-dependent oxidoreductase [FCB group bacterium]